MKYEFHVGDYVEMIGGFVGWVRQTREGFIWVANKDTASCSFRIPEDLDCFKRIGQYDFTKTEPKSIERLPVDLVARFEVPDGRYITTKTWDENGKFVEASYSRELIDKINELINVVNELQEDYNTHLEAHKQNER